MPKTLYDKIWEDHLVHKQTDGTSLIYVDRHLVHEVTSPQAFEGLRLQKRKVRSCCFREIAYLKSMQRRLLLFVWSSKTSSACTRRSLQHFFEQLQTYSSFTLLVSSPSRNGHGGIMEKDRASRSACSRTLCLPKLFTSISSKNMVFQKLLMPT